MEQATLLRTLLDNSVSLFSAQQRQCPAIGQAKAMRRAVLQLSRLRAGRG